MVRVARCSTTKQISRACLAVSPSTVETHVRRAMARHGASTRVQASIATLSESSGRREDVLIVRHPAGDRCITLAPSGHRQPIDLDALPDAPWRLDGWLVRGVVRDADDVSRVALARVRGASLDVEVRCAAAVEAELIEMLDRTGGARVVTERLGSIDPADVELLALLAGGATVREHRVQARLLAPNRSTPARRAAAPVGRRHQP